MSNDPFPRCMKSPSAVDSVGKGMRKIQLLLPQTTGLWFEVVQCNAELLNVMCLKLI